MAHLEKRIKEEEPRAKKAKEANAGLLKELDGLKSQAQKLEKELGKLGFQPGTEEEMYKQESTLQQQILTVQEEERAQSRDGLNTDPGASTMPRAMARAARSVASLGVMSNDRSKSPRSISACRVPAEGTTRQITRLNFGKGPDFQSSLRT